MNKIKKILIFVLTLGLFLGFLWRGGVFDKSYEETQFCLDTVCTISVESGKDKEAVSEAFKRINEIHKLMNMYDKDSDVGRINSAKANEWIEVDESTYYVLERALEICEATKGSFDITIGQLSAIWSFKDGVEKVPIQSELVEKCKTVGYESIVLENGKVKKLRDDTWIDLGGAAKGYAGDEAKRILLENGVKSGLIDLGGNVIAFGDRDYTIGLQTPFAPAGSYEKTVEIRNKSVVTSGTYQRYFEKNNKIFHHILSPKNGYPVDREYDSVTVVCEESLLGDCLSTAIFVMGKEEGKDLAERYGCEVFFQ